MITGLSDTTVIEYFDKYAMYIKDMNDYNSLYDDAGIDEPVCPLSDEELRTMILIIAEDLKSPFSITVKSY